MNRRYNYFVIFGAQRSGSNLLEQSLNQFANIICHGELFNPSFIGHAKSNEFLGFGFQKREQSPVSLIKAMIDDVDEGIAGFRVFHDHDPRTAQIALEDPNCAKIILQRDQLESFVSLGIAKKTDQWLLHDAPDRRSAKMVFDADAFQTYRKKQDAYISNIRKTLQETGQSAFWMRYPEQKNINVLNGLVKFLGQDEVLKTVKETIRRQNPGSLRDKIENYDAVEASLSSWNETTDPDATLDPLRRANIPKIVSCIGHPILFLPIPGGPNEEVLRWMNALDGGYTPKTAFAHAVENSMILHQGHNQKTLFEWMEANPDVVTLTATRHPIPRAYKVFMSKIFSTGPHSYKAIRKQLINYFGLGLPGPDNMGDVTRKTLQADGYGIREHRAAFHAFLRFLKSNLADQTSIRRDGLWDSQMTFLTGFNTAVPISLITKEGQMDAGFRYIESVLNLSAPSIGAPIQPEHMFTLDEIYTRQTENLARKVYSMDYIRFGFDDYQAALET